MKGASHSILTVLGMSLSQICLFVKTGLWDCTHGFQMPLLCPKGVGWGNMGYLIPEAATGDWAKEILDVQIPTYVPMWPPLGGGA